MSGRLRVFISSTMKDLANERDAVVRRLREFNFEPINAEGWLPSGGRAWDRIQQELESSHLAVLVLGEKYGFIPDHGPGVEQGLSVTHMEYRAARELGITVLPFFKRLEDPAAGDAEEVKRREAFRKEVSDWEQGYVVTRFDLASDLADKVGRAVVDVLSTQWQDKIQQRTAAVAKVASALTPQRKEERTAVPPALVQAVRERRAVLFAGAGISLEAGFPSAKAIFESLLRRIREYEPAYDGSGLSLDGVAADLETVAGRKVLLEAILAMMNPPQGVRPTDSHLHGVRLFDYVLTTNFDSLFEQARDTAGRDHAAVVEDLPAGGLPERAILKLRGSASVPRSLIETEQDLKSLAAKAPRLLQAVRELLSTREVVVVGSSLRGLGVAQHFIDAEPRVRGYFVAPRLNAVDRQRIARWNLYPVPSSAGAFFQALAEAIEG